MLHWLNHIATAITHATKELCGIREACERIATALERQTAPRKPASVSWHHASPQEE